MNRTTSNIIATIFIYPDNWSTRDLAKVLGLSARDLSARLRQLERGHKLIRTSHATHGRFGRSATWALDATFVRTTPVLFEAILGRPTTASKLIKKRGSSGRNSGRTERSKRSPISYT